MRARRRSESPQRKESSTRAFGALEGSSQKIKEVFGQIASSSSKIVKSIKEKLDIPDKKKSSDESKVQKSQRAISSKDKSSSSKRSKVDKSRQSKRGLRSGIQPSAKTPQARGADPRSTAY